MQSLCNAYDKDWKLSGHCMAFLLETLTENLSGWPVKYLNWTGELDWKMSDDCIISTDVMFNLFSYCIHTLTNLCGMFILSPPGIIYSEYIIQGIPLAVVMCNSLLQHQTQL